MAKLLKKQSTMLRFYSLTLHLKSLFNRCAIDQRLIKVKLFYKMLRLPNTQIPILLKLFKSVSSAEVLIREVLVLRTQENVTTVNVKDIMQNFVVNLRTFMKWTMIPQTLFKLKVRKTFLLKTVLHLCGYYRY